MISVMPRILKDDPTAQEFVNELNIAEDYKEPAKRKYNEKSFYFNAFCRLFFCLKIHFTAYHFVGHDFGGRGSHIHDIHQTSVVQDGTSVRDPFDFFQFMCDQDDSLAVIPQRFDNIQQEIDLLRCQNRCGFIENKDFCFSVKHL